MHTSPGFPCIPGELLGLHGEGTQQAKEASEILGRLGNTAGRARYLVDFAQLLWRQKQFDAAFHTIGLQEKGGQFEVYQAHRVLGRVYRSEGETENAIHHFEVALVIASSFNWNVELFWVHYSLTDPPPNKGRFDDAHAHAEQAKSRADDGPYLLGHAMYTQARAWYRQRRLEEVRSGALCAADAFEKLGAAEDTEFCRKLLQRIEKELNYAVRCAQKKPIIHVSSRCKSRARTHLAG